MGPNCTLDHKTGALLYSQCSAKTLQLAINITS